MSDLSVQQVSPVQNYDVQQGAPSVPYYKSNVGLKTGAILSIPAVIDFLPDVRLKNKDYFEKTINKYQNDIESAQKNIDAIIKDGNYPEKLNNYLKKYKDSMPSAEAFRKTCSRKGELAVPATLIATGCTIGGGMLVDAVRNDKAKKTADQIGVAQNNSAEAKIRNISVSDSGIPYYNSNIGKCLGIPLGAACGILSAYLNGGLAKTKTNTVIRAVIFALGGLVTGSIYDNIVNKKSNNALNEIA